MKTSKIKSQFNFPIEQAGFLFIIGLFLGCFSLVIFQRLDFLSLIILVSLAVYLVYSILIKFNFKIFILVVLVFSGLALKTQIDFQHQKVPTAKQLYYVNPDKVTIQDDFAYGIAKTKSERISFTLKIDQNFKKLVKQGDTFSLWPKNIEVNLVKQATNPAEFDLRSYYQRKRIKYQVEFSDYQVGLKRQSIFNYLEALRLKIKRYFNQLPFNLRFFAGQLFLGEDLTRNKSEIRDNYRNLGVIHLLCISGMHVLLYTKIITVIGSLFRVSPRLVLYCKILILFLLLFLSGFQPGITRAVLGFLINCCLNAKEKPINQFDRLALTLICHLFFVPDLLLNIGAQLSYLLVLGLCLTSELNYWSRNFFLNLLISPILILNFYEINLLTIFYNFIIVPVFNCVILPATFLGLCFSFISSPMMIIFDEILEIVNRGIGLVGTQKIGLILIGKIFGFVALILLFLIITYLIIKPCQKLVFQKVGKLTVFLGVVLFLLNVVIIKFPITANVNFIDIGQGDSILITTAFLRKSYLIDTGGKLSFGKKKTTKCNVEKITIPFLKSQGIKKLDGVFLTHQDADHLGDLDKLLAKIQVERVYFAQGMQNNYNFYRKIKNSINQVKLVPVTAGQKIKSGPVSFNILYPNYLSTGKNEDSLTILLQIQHHSWFLSGDLDQAGEEKLLDLYPNLRLNYFKLGHHGSKTSTSKKFLEQTKPDIGIISAGRNNRYGHPHEETINVLKSQKVQFLNTAEYGMISWYYRPDGTTGFKTYLGGQTRAIR